MSEEIKFEKAIERLEKIVEELETGDIALEEALKKYEEGVKLSQVCQHKLTQAEKKIETLTRTLDGSLKKEPFEINEAGEANQTNAAAETSRRNLRKIKGKREDEDGDLLI